MTRPARLASLQLLSCALAFAAHAEGFLDLYGGVAPTPSADVTVTEFAPFFTQATAQRNVSFGASSTFGARAGGWTSNVSWFGLALDVSSVRASGSDLDVGAIPVSALLMFRAEPSSKLSSNPMPRSGRARSSSQSCASISGRRSRRALPSRPAEVGVSICAVGSPGSSARGSHCLRSTATSGSTSGTNRRDA